MLQKHHRFHPGHIVSSASEQ